jgi:ABC-type bacteriocin/lantibiotic exporter with double-glycine peptidase domain
MLRNTTPVARIWQLIKEERSTFSSIYFYAILAGLIQLSLPVGIQSIINFVLGGTFSTSLVILIIAVVGGVLATGLMYINQMKLIEKIQQTLFVRYTQGIANKLPLIDLRKADELYLPELVNRFFEIPALQKGLSKLLLDFPTASIQILFGLILLSFYHPAFILFGILLIVVLGGILYYTGAKGLASSLEESKHKYSLAAWLEEMARGIKAFKFEPDGPVLTRNAERRTIRYLDKRTEHFQILLFQYRVLVAFKTIITAGMLLVGSLLLLDQQLNIGQFIAAEIVIIIVIGAVEKLIGNLDSVYDVLTSVDKMAKLTDKEEEETGKLAMPWRNEGVSIHIKNLRFGFQENHPILKVTEAMIPAGGKACIVGPEGSGKSTLLQLMGGIYTGFEGELSIDGIPLSNYQLDSLRAQIGISLSGLHIFQGTVWENVTLGKMEIPVDELMEISKKIHFDKQIQGWDAGWDTKVSPLGARLSGSTIRKILLMRALAKKPRLLLLEEPWRGCSTEDRIAIQDFLLQLPSSTTVVVVTNDSDFIGRAPYRIEMHTSDQESKNQSA